MKNMRNKVQLIGNLGKDPEVRTLDSGKKMARFTLATNENYKNAKGEKVTETQWHQLVAWGKTAEVIEQYVQKGQEIAVDGKLITREWNDKEGIKRYTTEIVVSDMLMLAKRA